VITQEQRLKLHKLTDDYLEELGVFKSCINCEQFMHTEEKCGKYNLRPPAETIAKGCDDWFEEIPF